MALNYYTAIKQTITGELSDIWKDDFQAFVDEEFQNASNYYVIKKENNLNELVDVGVRLVAPYRISASSSIKDDFKTVEFQRYDTNLLMGERYFFDGYWWITIDTGRSKSSSASCLVQRCADFLRFYDDKGVYHSIPAIVQKGGFYDLKKDQMVMIPDNQLRILVKYDDESKLIKWADTESAENKFTRFLLEGYPYRTTSIDRHSYVRLGVGYVDIRLQADQLQDGDDLINNIANANIQISINIENGATLTIGEAQEVQLNTFVTVNGVQLINPVVIYSSDDESIATVDGNGLVTGVTSGNATITATYSTVSTSIDITVDSFVNDNYTVDISSSNGVENVIRLGQTLQYTATSLLNGSPYVNVGTWSLLKSDGITPYTDTNLTIVSIVDNVLVLKCQNQSAFTGVNFKLKYADSNAEDVLDIQIKSVF